MTNEFIQWAVIILLMWIINKLLDAVSFLQKLKLGEIEKELQENLAKRKKNEA